MTDQAPPPGDDQHRSGFIAVIGRPNVGKSTLVNQLVGENIAPISPVPQTTRKRLLGILSEERGQAVFVDTPGIHDPKLKLGESMLGEVSAALVDADLVLAMFDATRPPGQEDEQTRQTATNCPAQTLYVVNKIDAAPSDSPAVASFLDWLAPETACLTSALHGDGLPELLTRIFELLPVGPPYFPPDQIADVYEREIASELIREAALTRLQQEVPHAVAVRVEEWQERPNGMTYVQAYVYVERESQKGIVIGQGGRTLKAIGQAARERLEQWLGSRVYLELRVKVLKGWRKDENALRWLGYLRRS